MRSLRSAGFSLIEVALALAVVAIAVVAILGVMPLGLGVHRESKETQTATLILNSLAARLRQASQSENPKLSLPEISFPLPGDPPTSTFVYIGRTGQTLGRTKTAQSAFRARVEIAAPTVSNPLGEAFIEVSWPATEPASSRSVGSVESVVSLPTRSPL